MPKPIDRLTLQRLVAAGAQHVEVLPKDEYDDEHLPGAVHLPLKSLSPTATADLGTDRPVIVYCWDAV